MQIDDLIIDARISTLDAMRRLEETGRRILFIAPGGKLGAVLTDSDVRKFILRGGDLTRPASEVANQHPKSLPVEQRAAAKDFLLRHSIEAVPLLDKDGAIADVVFLNDLDGIAPPKRLDLPVVIMAGGLGTRLYPYTKILPKPLIPVGEVPIIERVIQSFAAFGCRQFTLVVNYRRNMIKSYFADLEDKAYTVDFVDEDEPLGTGGGLYLLKGKMHTPFFFTNCDTLINADYADVYKQHQKQGNTITMVCAMKEFVIPYGVVQLGEDGTLASIAEKPRMNHLTNTGVYVVSPEVVEQMPSREALGFPDIIDSCRAAGARVGVYPVGEASWMDMGQLEELDEMRRRFEE
ncbi:NTP transferase domain-containing protein, partial [Ruminococcaceae bacterium OttesenSCG-928-O06]|nr:NTP transferase domain-containing protein [Ruminococcaceae bacterium OttesenSCG-928-O06]